MPYTFIPSNIAGGSGIINPAVAVTAFGNAPNTISGVNLGVGVVRGDGSDVVGSTSNDGVYVVLDVIDANTIEVFPAVTFEGPLGLVTIREQNNLLVIVDEAVVTATSIAAAMALLDPRIFGRRFAVAAQTAGREFNIYGFLIRNFVFNNTAGFVTDFLTESEVWFLDWDGTVRSGGTIASDWAIGGSNVAAAGALVNFHVGSLADVNDPRSVQRGSVFLNCQFLNQINSEISPSVYGSFMHSGQSSFFYAFKDGPAPGVSQVSGSIFHAGIIAPSAGGTMDALQTVIQNAPNFGLAPLGPIANAANFLQADAASFGVIFSAVEVVIREVELSDATFTPTQLLFSAGAQFIDPREDYTAAELFQLSGAAAAKSYTFNPRIVDINFVAGPSPLVGAEVTIERISDGHYVLFTNQTDGTYTLTINGEDHTHVSAGQSTAALRNSFVGILNAGSQPVTANPGNNSGQLGNTNSIIILNADVADTPFTIEVTQEPTPGDVSIDPAPIGGGAALLSQDYREIPIPGSPFIVDGNGRIDTDGVEIASFIGYETGIGVRFINLQYRIIVEGGGLRRVLDGYKPTSPFRADFPVEDKSMGVLAA